MALRGLKEWGEDALRVVFPLVCEVCGRSLARGEEVMCLHCNVDLPRTRLHLEDFNTIHQRIVGKAPIKRAAGYFYYYRESDYARMIQRAKYNNRPKILTQLAKCYIREIERDGFFEGIDLIQPVPMHWSKKLRRGYNQSEVIAKAVSNAIGVPIGDFLATTHRKNSQTRKGRFDRWLNAKDAYVVKNVDKLQCKHILIVDDVVTTGATILACCEAIHNALPNVHISVMSLGVTHLQ